MSCKILVDFDENALPSSPTPGSSKRRNIPLAQRILNVFTFRLYLRRLKFYMAALVTVALLFLLIFKFNSSQVATENHDANNRLEDPPQFQRRQQQLHKQQQQQQPLATDPNAMLKGTQVYPNNLTYLLMAKDFAQMKNINVMQVRIKEAMKHSWDNYRRYAWSYDMLKPRSKEADHWFNLGLTIVDSVDSLIMMGMTHDINLAIDWIENELKFRTKSENSNCFELTIRILAGILSAYHLTGREALKHQAIEFGNVLLHCYDTESKIIPYSDIDLNTHRGHPPPWNPHSSLSEVSSLQLEFRYLSQISGNPIYEKTTFQTSVHLHNLTQLRESKLLPMYVSPIDGQLEGSVITLGARTDSYYEYLLKQYLQTGFKWLEEDYLDCMDEMESKLLMHTNGLQNYTYVAELQIFKTSNNTDDYKYYHKMDHLVCFLPGTLALGYYHFSPLAADNRLKYNLETPYHKLNSRYDKHMNLALLLARTCHHMYSDMGTGLAAEISNFVPKTNQSIDETTEQQPELQVQAQSAHNILRPEFVESLFYLYHITGLEKFRSQASDIFDSFQEYSRISSGYSPISDVRRKPVDKSEIPQLYQHAPDRMESFWLSETLKYLYLIFCDDRQLVGTLLNHYVFNTEGHMLPILSQTGAN